MSSESFCGGGSATRSAGRARTTVGAARPCTPITARPLHPRQRDTACRPNQPTKLSITAPSQCTACSAPRTAADRPSARPHASLIYRHAVRSARRPLQLVIPRARAQAAGNPGRPAHRSASSSAGGEGRGNRTVCHQHARARTRPLGRAEADSGRRRLAHRIAARRPETNKLRARRHDARGAKCDGEHATDNGGLTSAVSGVNSLGFMTIVQPHARAGATFHALRARARSGSAAAARGAERRGRTTSGWGSSRGCCDGADVVSVHVPLRSRGARWQRYEISMREMGGSGLVQQRWSTVLLQNCTRRC